MGIFHIFNKEEELKAIITDENTDGNNIPLLSVMTHSQLGSYETIELVISAGHIDTKEIPEDGSILYEDELLGWREFQTSRVTDEDSESVKKVIYGELSSVELEDHKIAHHQIINKQLKEQAGMMLAGTRFEVGNIDPAIKDVKVELKEIRHLSVLEGVFLLAKKYHCETYFTYEVSENRVVKRYVNFMARLGGNKGKRFEVGKDVMSVKREIDYTGIKTAIIPTGKAEHKDGAEDEELTIKDVVWKKPLDPEDKPKGQEWLGDETALKRWGRKTTGGKLVHRYAHVDFNIKDPQELIRMAWVELGKYKNPKITYTLGVVDLFKLTGDTDLAHEAVVLGDVVSVIDNYFPTPLFVTARVTKLDKDLIDPANTVVTLGDIQQTFTSHAMSRDEKLHDFIQDVKDTKLEFVNGINKGTEVTHGSEEPKKPKKGDTWFRPHPDKPSETQILSWDGTQWVVDVDTSRVNVVEEQNKAIQKDIEDANKSVEAMKVVADNGLKTAQEAEKKAQEVAKNFGEVDGKISTIKKTADDAKSEAVKSAQELAQVKKDADEFSKGHKIFKEKTETQISAVQGELSGMVKKTEYDGLAQTVKSQGTSLSQTAEALKTKAEKSLVDNLNKQVATASSEVKVMAGKVDSVVKTADANSLKISKQEQTAESLKTTISKVETDLKGMEVGGRNLLLDTASLKSNKGGAKISGELFNGNSVVESLPPLNASTYTDTFTQMTSIAPKAKSYICTFWAKSSKKGTEIYNHFYSPSNTTKSINSQGKVTTSSDGQSSLSLSDKWEKYWIMWEQNESERQKWFLLGRVFKESNAVVYISSPALYEGTVPKDWSPAPEDLATVTELSTVEQTIKGLQTTVANKAEKSQVTQLAGQVTSAITTAEGAESKVAQMGNQFSVVLKDTQGMRSELHLMQNQISSIVKQSSSANALHNPDGFDGLDGWTVEPFFASDKFVVDSNPEACIGKSKGFVYNGSEVLPKIYALKSDIVSVTAGTSNSASVSVKVLSGTPDRSVKFKLEYYDEISSKLPVSTREVEISNTVKGWQLLKIEGFTVPEGCRYARVTFVVQKSAHVSFCQPQLIVGALKVPNYGSGSANDLESKVTQLAGLVATSVKKGDVISSINQSPEKISLDARLIHITGQTVIDNASIRSSAIQSLSADKITAGTLNAKDIKVVNLDAGSITTGVLKAITLQGNNLTINLSTGDVSFKKGQIRSLNDLFCIDITNGILYTRGKFSLAGMLGNQVSGVTMTNGAITFEHSRADGTYYPVGNIRAIGTKEGAETGKKFGLSFECYEAPTVANKSSAIGMYTASYNTKEIRGNDTSQKGAGIWMTDTISGSVNRGDILMFGKSSIKLATGHTSALNVGTYLTLDTALKFFGQKIDLGANTSISVSTGGTLQLIGRKSVTVKGNCTFTDNLSVSGKKNAIHVTRDGVRETPAYELAESFLGDLGKAKTDSDCTAVIKVDELFSDTVNMGIDYHVFISAYTDDVIWVEDMTSDSFTVKSRKPLSEFSWELKAKRKGYESDRLVLDESFDNELIEKTFRETA